MHSLNRFHWLIFLLTLVCLGTGLGAENRFQLLFDDFQTDAQDVDRSIWITPQGRSGCFGRTVIRNPHSTADFRSKTQVSSGMAKLVLSTFNPEIPDSAVYFWGSEIDSIKQFSLPAHGGGIEFSARVRWPKPLPKGIVTALFAYGLIRGEDCDYKDEIDFELASNHIQPGTGKAKVLLNWYKDQPPGVGRPQLIETPGLDPTEFNVIAIRWYPERIEWFVNQQLVYRTSEAIPKGPMSVRLNIWAPAADFPIAFDPTLQPTANRNLNRDYHFDIDWVRVSRIPQDP